MERMRATASSATAPAPMATATGNAPMRDDDDRPWASVGTAVRRVKGAAPQSANPNRLRNPSGLMRPPQAVMTRNPAEAGTSRRENASAPNRIHIAARRRGEPESGNLTGQGIHEKESL